MAAGIIGSVGGLLFLRHWFGAFDLAGERDVVSGVEAFWGGLFTVASFLTTTGFVSTDWDVARAGRGSRRRGSSSWVWPSSAAGSGTTAGGVKLLRVYALYIHGKREMDRLIHPSSIGGAGPVARQLRRQGAPLAWIFFMLFAFSIALGMAAFALTGQISRTRSSSRSPRCPRPGRSSASRATPRSGSISWATRPSSSSPPR
jgi:trk system potassium uptake protein